MFSEKSPLLASCLQPCSVVSTTKHLVHETTALVLINTPQNTELMDRKLKIVEVIVNSLWIVEVFFKNSICWGKIYAFKNFELTSCFTLKYRGFREETKIICLKEVFESTLFELMRYNCNWIIIESTPVSVASIQERFDAVLVLVML